VRQAGRGR
jgi:hypothetical protein